MKKPLPAWLSSPKTIAIAVTLAVLVQGGIYLWQNHHLRYTTPAGAIAWKTLGGAKESSFDAEGVHTPRSFPPEVKKLDYQQVRIQGYMIAMKPSASFSEFMLTSTPPSCPYCLQGDATQVVHVFMQESTESTGEPVIVNGRLELQRLTGGVFYELHNAVIVTE